MSRADVGTGAHAQQHAVEEVLARCPLCIHAGPSHRLQEHLRDNHKPSGRGWRVPLDVALRAPVMAVCERYRLLPSAFVSAAVECQLRRLQERA